MNLKQFESFNLNEKPDQLLPLGSAENKSVPNPFFGVVPSNTSLGASPTIQQKQLWSAYPQFTSLTIQEANTGRATYNALQMKAEKRMTHGPTFLWTFTHSKLRMAFAYQMPLRFSGSMAKRILDKAVGGWEVGGYLTLESGTPLNISDSNGRPIRLRNAAKDGPVSDRLGDTRGINHSPREVCCRLAHRCLCL